MADLSIDIGGIKFKNPIVAAAGEPTTDYEHMTAAIKAGAGGVVAKSIAFSPHLAKSYDHARWTVIDENRRACRKGKYPKMFTFYGRGGIPMEPPDWMDTLKAVQAVADRYGAVLIGSIGTGPLDKMVETAQRMERAGIKIIELDAGCPQVSQLGLEDTSKELITAAGIAGTIAREVVKAVNVPVIYKVAAEDAEKLETVKSVQDAGVHAVTLMNRYVGFLVDIETGKPHIGSKAGVGGPWMLPLSLRWVSEAYQKYPNLAICGSNGAYDWQDAVQFLMSGATVVQFCTVLMLKGYKVITDTVQKLAEFMDGHGYSSVKEMVGLAARNAKTYEELYAHQQKAYLDEEKCISCDKCIDACFYQGIERNGETLVITENCKGCGMCEIACPAGAIMLGAKTGNGA